jgi:pimeloyl-ACP methyl ester carboxylesterase
VAGAAGAGAAQAAISWTMCGTSSEFACGHLSVPLDPSGASAGTITLALRRHRAPLGEAHSAIVALAGGPGQAALPLTSEFVEALGPAAATRDVIVFDQRGTGLSHRLECRFARPRGHGVAYPPAIAVKRCGESLGPSRAFYTTPDSVADIEAIREAAGYEKLVLYGTSYGTKVAEQYAAAYPQHVEALVLDSVVAPNGPDPFELSSFAALPRILRTLCAHRECARITRDPVFDLARLVQRMHGGALRGRAIDGYGRAHIERIEADELLAILFEGDFDPLLRAELISAVRAAVLGDDAALARLLAHAEHGEEFTSAPEALYLATICEEEPIPWNRQAPAGVRLAEATARLRALPARTFSPFIAATALDLSDARTCADWPFATPAPPLEHAPLPNVPTLILSGAADLRTPTETAREVAAQIPDAHLVVVPLAGHSVLGSNFGECAVEALKAMFTNAPIKSCVVRRPPPFLRVPPLPPRNLAHVSAEHGYHGRVGRTLHAVVLTLSDALHQFESALLERLDSESFGGSFSLRGGGLRAGFYELNSRRLAFHGYSYIPGVRVSGTDTSGRFRLSVGGSAAALGTLKSGPRDSLIGELGGEGIDVSARGGVTIARARGAQRAGSPLARARTQALALLGGALATLIARG